MTILSQNPPDHLPVDIGKAEVPAAEAVGELLMIEAQQVKDGGVQIVNGQDVLHGAVAVFVGGPENWCRP